MSNKNLRDLMADLEAGGVTEYRVSQGSVPAFAIDEINSALRDVCHTQIPADFDTRWVVDEGELRGKFPKRVMQYIRKNGQEDEHVSTSVLSLIGNIAKQSAPPDQVVYVDVTSDLDWKASDYGDSGSCFWGCKKTGRYALMELECYALRFYDKVIAQPAPDGYDTHGARMSENGEYNLEYQDKMYLVTPSDKLTAAINRIKRGDNYGQTMPGRLVMQDNQFFCGVGRAWIIPNKPMPNDALVFNMYHMMQDYRLVHAAHILSEMLDLGGVKLVKYYNYDSSEGDLHINSAAGALVSTIERLKLMKRRTVRTHIDCEDYWQCNICRKIERSNEDDNAMFIGYDTVCKKCYADNCVRCKNCNSMKPATDIIQTYSFVQHVDGVYKSYEVGEVCPECNRNENVLICRGNNTGGGVARDRKTCGTLISIPHTDDSVLVYDLERNVHIALCPICAADSVKFGYCVLCCRVPITDGSSQFHRWTINNYVMDGVEFCMCSACSFGYDTIHRFLGTRLFFADFEEDDDAFGIVESRNRRDRNRTRAVVQELVYATSYVVGGRNNDMHFDINLRRAAADGAKGLHRYTFNDLLNDIMDNTEEVDEEN